MTKLKNSWTCWVNNWNRKIFLKNHLPNFKSKIKSTLQSANSLTTHLQRMQPSLLSPMSTPKQLKPSTPNHSLPLPHTFSTQSTQFHSSKNPLNHFLIPFNSSHISTTKIPNNSWKSREFKIRLRSLTQTFITSVNKVISISLLSLRISILSELKWNSTVRTTLHFTLD